MSILLGAGYSAARKCRLLFMLYTISLLLGFYSRALCDDVSGFYAAQKMDMAARTQPSFDDLFEALQQEGAARTQPSFDDLFEALQQEGAARTQPSFDDLFEALQQEGDARTQPSFDDLFEALQQEGDETGGSDGETTPPTRGIDATQLPDTGKVVRYSPSRMVTHSCSEYGFSIRFPGDWTKKTGVLGDTVLKAVKLVDGEKIVLTVTATAHNGGSIAETTEDDLTALTKHIFGEDRTTVLHSARGQIGGQTCIRRLLGVVLARDRPKVIYSTTVSRGAYIYIASLTADPSLYKKYSHIIRDVGNSFNFTTAPAVRARSFSIDSRTEAEREAEERRGTLKPSEYGFLTALLKSITEVWLELLIFGFVVSSIGAAMVKRN